MRVPILAGNWKMNLGLKEALELTGALCEAGFDAGTREVILAPSFVNIYPVFIKCTSVESPIAVAGQDAYFEDSGAYTGEVSASMLKSAGATAVIIGHSERRQLFGDTDEVVNRKVLKALSTGLRVILCCGETLEEREAGKAEEVVLRQIQNGLSGVVESDMDNIVVAYEPVWAIGTGKTASSDDAEAMHAAIRSKLTGMCGQGIADSVRILYGGSVKPDNVKELMSMPNIDGALVGGASLKADSFLKIINFENQ